MGSGLREATPSGGGTVVGRYVLHDEIASGGMASVHLGRLLGPLGFQRTVAIKRLHPEYARDPDFVAMLMDEGRVAARIRHPNVVSTLDMATTDGEMFLVMDYVHGESLARLVQVARERGETAPPAVACGIMVGVLYGLHAAHEATDERGAPLGVVHRDVSPHNILVGVDGVARVVDFGIAKAVARLQTTAEGQIKGKIAYMSPEQLRQGHLDRRADVFGASIVLWELLTGRTLFGDGDAAAVATKVLHAEVLAPSQLSPGLPPALDRVVLRGLSRDPDERFATAQELLLALESATPPASPAAVGEWVKRCVGASLERRAVRIVEIETSPVPEALGSSGGEAVPGQAAEAFRRRASMETAVVDRLGAEDTSVEARHLGALVTDGSLAVAVAGSAPRQRRALIAVSATGLLLVTFVAFFIQARVGPEEARTGSASSASPPASEPQAIAAPPESVVAPVSASGSPRTAGDPPAPGARRRPRAPDCDPPYVFDAVRHIRVYKKQCQ